MSLPALIYRLKGDFQEIGRAMDTVEQFGRVQHLDSQTAHCLDAAVEEVLSDMTLQGHAREIELCFSIGDDMATVEISDDAAPSDPRCLGLLEAEKQVDGIEYRPREHGNLLILRKKRARHPRETAC